MLALLLLFGFGFRDHELGELYPLAHVDSPVVREAASSILSFPQASGFLISEDGLALTNAHVAVVVGEKTTVVRQASEIHEPWPLAADLIAVDVERDLALYRVHSEQPLPYLSLRAERPHKGERVAAVGHPSNLPIRAGFGRVLTESVTIEDRRSVEYSAQTLWGSSGSPVVDEQGRVVAIHWGWDADGESKGRLLGIPVDDIHAALSEWEAEGRISLAAP